MLKINELKVDGYETVIEAKDPEVHLHCFIAIHNTRLGPALGGVRLKTYTSTQEALQDALNLAKAMTYKSALAETGLGGGKSVIIATDAQKSEELLLAFGQVIDSLKGRYIAAEDVGTNPEDMEIIRKKTPYVAALPSEKSSGDPSRFTAWGVYKGIQAVLKTLKGSKSLKHQRVAIQGLGNVGRKLADILFWEGADLILCETNPSKLHSLALLYGADVVDSTEYFQVECDILAPCALGGVINEDSIPLLRCQAIAGAANNQLANANCGRLLLDKNILYAPDFIINAGGIINAAQEFHTKKYNPKIARNKVNHIYETLINVLKRSEMENQPTNLIANELAENHLKHLIGKRMSPMPWEMT